MRWCVITSWLHSNCLSSLQQIDYWLSKIIILTNSILLCFASLLPISDHIIFIIFWTHDRNSDEKSNKHIDYVVASRLFLRGATLTTQMTGFYCVFVCEGYFNHDQINLDRGLLVFTAVILASKYIKMTHFSGCMSTCLSRSLKTSSSMSAFLRGNLIIQTHLKSIRIIHYGRVLRWAAKTSGTFGRSSFCFFLYKRLPGTITI